MKWPITFASVILALAAQAVVAQTDPEITGEVVEARPEANELTIRVLEADEERPEQAGQTEVYHVPPGTEIKLDRDDSLFSGSRNLPREVELGDLRAGDRVVIGFQETAEGRQATSIRSEPSGAGQDRQQTVQDDQATDTYDDTYAAGSTEQRDRLPGSASPLPLVALIGVVFAVIGGALRFRRRRDG